VLLGLAGGCSSAWYERSADLQVNKLLADRKEQTLGYSPQTQVPGKPPAKAPGEAYAKIPVTPIPPPSESPMEPVHIELPYGPLGPSARSAASGPATQSETFGVHAADERAVETFALGPPAPGEPMRRLDLFGALEFSVQHSRDYQTQMETLYLAALDVTLQRHLFEPRPFVQTGVNFTGGQKDVDYRAAMNATATAGVKQQLPYGGEIVAQSLVGFVNALNSSAQSGESASVTLAATVPLLRGAGWVNLEPLISSERNLVYVARSFEDYRREFLVRIASQYFSLVTQQKGLANRRQNYENLALLTERTQSLYDAGRLSFLEVQRALQAQLQAENDLINAQEGYLSALDNFKLIMGMPVEQPMDIVPVQLELNIPAAPVEEVVKLATRYRLDLQTARDQIEDSRRDVQVAENALLPDLNLGAQAGAGNEPLTPAANLEKRTITYSAGITLDLPVDKLAERNAYRRSIIGFHQSQRRYEELQDRIIVSARDAWRSIHSAEQGLRIQRAGIDLAQRRVDFANELLKQGTASSRDVVEAQNSLLSAQDLYERALAQLQTQMLQYLKQTGTLRVDPDSGSFGRALDRQRIQQTNAPENSINQQ
jgi:outer membrane protein TolC